MIREAVGDELATEVFDLDIDLRHEIDRPLLVDTKILPQASKLDVSGANRNFDS